MKLNSKVINVTLNECECELLKDLLNCCLCFTHEIYSDDENLDSVNLIKSHLTGSDKDL